MKILKEGRSKKYLVEKNYVLNQIKSISARLISITNAKEPPSDEVIISEFAICSDMITMILDNMVYID